MGDCGEASCDFGVSSLGGVLITQRSGRGGVSESAHQFGEGCSCLGGEDGAGVSEVVPAQVGSSGCLAGGVVDAVKRRGGDV